MNGRMTRTAAPADVESFRTEGWFVVDARSALSKKPLDDRLLVARDGRWLDEPIRERELDLLAILTNYDQS